MPPECNQVTNYVVTLPDRKWWISECMHLLSPPCSNNRGMQAIHIIKTFKDFNKGHNGNKIQIGSTIVLSSSKYIDRWVNSTY